MRLKRRLLFYRPTRPTRLRVYFFFSQPFFPQMLALLWLFLSSLVVLLCSSVVCLVLFTQGFHSQNFCAIFAERTAKFFFLCASVLREKKQQFAQSFTKVISRKIALYRFCKTQVFRNSATRVLRNSAIPQFRKNQTVGDGVCFSEFNSSSAGRFCTKIRNRLSSKSLDNFSFGHANFLKVDSSGIGYFLALCYMR